MIQTIQDVSDCVALYLPHSLYLKPSAKFNVSVALPNAITGKTISNYEVMEKMRQMILPDKFSVLKVSKSTVGLIRFEGELEDRSKLRHVLGRLDGRPIRLPGFSESVKLRASEAKDDFPTRHDWDSFFRDARNMDEMKAGERPDTIHFANLPIKWFCPRHMENESNAKPSESIFKRIFEKFGDVRCVDIPICDPYRSQMKAHMSGMQKFSFDQEMYFEGYVQFSEYVGFVKAMDEFRGMKLVHKEVDKNLAVSITVDFDRTKHLSDSSIKKRKVVRDRLISADRDKEEQEKKRVADEEAKKERERKRQEEQRKTEELKRMQREQRRKEKHLQKLRQKETDEISLKILQEERKLMETQRKLESIRLIDSLFERMKIKQTLLDGKFSKNESSKKSSIPANKKVDKLKAAQQKEMDKMRQRVKDVKDGNLLKNFLGNASHSPVERSRSPSINTISSDDSILNDFPTDARGKKKKKKKNNSDDSSEAEPTEEEPETAPETSATTAVPYPAVPPAMGAYPGMYPGFDWAAMGYAYPYDPYYAQRAEYYASAMAYRGYRGAPRGTRYSRARGRGGYRGRGYGYYREDGYGDYDYHDRDRSRSYSRSRSRSRSRRRRSRSRSRGRSRSRSRSRRSRSRTRSSRSRSRSRSTRSRRSRSRSRSDRSRSRSRRSESKSKKPVQMSKPTAKHLASTMRDSRTKSRSNSRSKSRSRSRSHYRHRSRHRHRSHRRRSYTKEPEDETVPESFRKHRIVLQTDKLVKSAKEIEEEVREHLRKQQEEEERRLKEAEENNHDGNISETATEGTSRNHKDSKRHSRRSSRSRSKSTPRPKSPPKLYSKSPSPTKSRTESPGKNRKSRKEPSRSKSPAKEKRPKNRNRRDSFRSNSPNGPSTKEGRHKNEDSERNDRRQHKSHSDRSDHKRKSRSIDSARLSSPKRKHRDSSP